MLIQGDEAILLSYCNLRIRVYKLYGYSSQHVKMWNFWHEGQFVVRFTMHILVLFLYNTDNTSSEDIG